MNVYSHVSERVTGELWFDIYFNLMTANKTAVSKIKRDLIECKSLLYCNREELRRLWLELVEFRRCLELIDDLDCLKSTPDALTSLINCRAWCEATRLIRNASDLMNTDIASIPAVQSVKSDIAHKHKVLSYV